MMMRLLQFSFVATVAAMASILLGGCEEFIDSLAEDTYCVRCENNKLQTYKVKGGPAFSLVSSEVETKVDNSPLNGLDCSKSTEDQNRAFSMSEATTRGILAPTAPPAHGTATSTPAQSVSLVNTFPFLAPLIFNPGFPASDAGKAPGGCNSSWQAYLVSHTRATVTAFGLCPLQMIKVIPVTSHPLQVAITPNGSTALVTSYDGALTFISTATNTVTATLNLSDYNPSGIAISPDSTRAYVTHYYDVQPALVVIDIPNRKVVGTIALPYRYPRQVIVTPDGSQAWVNYYDNRIVTVVDLLTSTVAGLVNIGQSVSTGMAFNPTGTKAYIAVYPSQLYVVTTTDWKVTAMLNVGDSPSDVVVSADGRRVFVTSETQPGMWWIDTASDKVIAHTAPAGTSTGGSMGLVVWQ